jgi:hypothetical protein
MPRVRPQFYTIQIHLAEAPFVSLEVRETTLRSLIAACSHHEDIRICQMKT